MLLLGDGPGANPSAGPTADNSRCHVCHIKYTFEDIAVAHARANIGCADCHGESDDHISDEFWSWVEKARHPTSYIAGTRSMISA